MITGSQVRRIKEYWLIDHLGDGGNRVHPTEGEEIWGVPYQFQSDLSYPYIEHVIDRKVVKTVNALDVSEIVFEA